MRLKDVGTRLQADERKNRIINLAKCLPEANRLTGRAIYWFVTTEDVNIIFQDTKLFVWNEKIKVGDDNGATFYYLNQINFRQNKCGRIMFQFPNEELETIYCISTQNKSSKRTNQDKISAPLRQASTSPSASDWNLLPQLFTNRYDNNEDISQGFNDSNEIFQPTAVDDGLKANNIDWNKDSLEQHVQTPPQVLWTGKQISSNEALIINTILLFPNNETILKMVDSALEKNEFEKQVDSANGQTLYSRNLTKTNQHVLIFPYGHQGGYARIADYMHYSSETILLLENEVEQPEDLMVITHVINIDGMFDKWNFTVETANTIKNIQLDYTALNQQVKKLFWIDQLRREPLGGVICRKGTQPVELLSDFILRWSLKPLQRHVIQNIYLCFKFASNVKSFNEYAHATLTTLDIAHTHDAVVVNGSVLVYVRCPGYIPWYILHHKDTNFQALNTLGLIEIYECFQGDIDKSMQRDDNAEFSTELMQLKEQMISDCVGEEPTPNRYAIKVKQVKVN
jgi:hypothetical protein